MMKFCEELEPLWALLRALQLKAQPSTLITRRLSHEVSSNLISGRNEGGLSHETGMVVPKMEKTIF